VQKWLQKINTDEAFARNWQSGIWRDEWKHWAHGIGCRLTHIHTGERIEWDAPDLQAFDEGWFWNHLIWRMEQNTSEDKFQPYSGWLSVIYDHMRTQNMIVANKDGKYVLAANKNRAAR
jgi:hypothetical protein